MSQYGIWVDQREAIVVQLPITDEGQPKVERIQSEVEDKHKSTGGGKGPAPFHQTSGAAALEKKIDERRDHELKHFISEIIRKVEGANVVAIFGPGQVKTRLEKEISAHKHMQPRVLTVEAAEQMTERQIIAKTREAFDRMPERRLPHPEER